MLFRSNPGYPSRWHVREDGWMGASSCMDGPLEVRRAAPLRLRFLLHVHAGAVDPPRAEEFAAQFADWPEFDIVCSSQPHQQYEVSVRS